MVSSIIAVIVSYCRGCSLLAFIAFHLRIYGGFRVHSRPASTSIDALVGIRGVSPRCRDYGGFICALIAKTGSAPLEWQSGSRLGLVVAIAAMNKGKKRTRGLVRTPTRKHGSGQKAYWPFWVPLTFPAKRDWGILNRRKN